MDFLYHREAQGFYDADAKEAQNKTAQEKVVIDCFDVYCDIQLLSNLNETGKKLLCHWTLSVCDGFTTTKCYWIPPFGPCSNMCY